MFQAQRLSPCLFRSCGVWRFQLIAILICLKTLLCFDQQIVRTLCLRGVNLFHYEPRPRKHLCSPRKYLCLIINCHIENITNFSINGNLSDSSYVIVRPDYSSRHWCWATGRTPQSVEKIGLDWLCYVADKSQTAPIICFLSFPGLRPYLHKNWKQLASPMPPVFLSLIFLDFGGVISSLLISVGILYAIDHN